MITKKSKIVHIFSSLANINGGLITDTEKELYENAKDIKRIIESSLFRFPTDLLLALAIREYIGRDWEVVWGTQILIETQKNKKCDKHVTTNTMFVVKGKKNPQKGFDKTPYIVAIAGTNPASIQNWLIQDLQVGILVPWGERNQGKIAIGSDFGLNKLLSMQDSDSGKTLIEFFDSVAESASEEYEIITCGHSLGGALSPLVALRLIERTYPQATVSCYPTAGPTSGNGTFVRYAEKQFGNNYHSVMNKFDIVPNAWNKKTYDAIPDLYDNKTFSYIKMDPITKVGWKIKKLEILGKDYQRIAKDKEYVFEGTYQKDTNIPLPKALSKFMKQAILQHISVYNTKVFYSGKTALLGSLVWLSLRNAKKMQEERVSS